LTVYVYVKQAARKLWCSAGRTDIWERWPTKH